MSTEVVEQHLEDLTKIPVHKQDKATLDDLYGLRKTLADKYFSNTTKYEEKQKIFPKLKKLHEYFGYKEIKKPFPPKGKKTVTIEERRANCDAFLDYIKDVDEPNTILALSRVWSNT